jgi:hypothetical protein
MTDSSTVLLLMLPKKGNEIFGGGGNAAVFDFVFLSSFSGVEPASELS